MGFGLSGRIDVGFVGFGKGGRWIDQFEAGGWVDSTKEHPPKSFLFWFLGLSPSLFVKTITRTSNHNVRAKVRRG